jgi:CBS domain-containing protein
MQVYATMAAPRVRDVMTKKVETIDEGQPLSTARERMLVSGARHLLVMREGQLAGVLSERDILRYEVEHSGGLAHPVRRAANMPAQQASPDDPLSEAIDRLAGHHLGCLPVVDERQKIVGVLTASDLLQSRLDGPRAMELMSKHPVIVRASDVLSVAADRMAANRVRHLPVVDAGGGLCGILSDRDLRGIPSESALESTPVSEVMTKNVISLPPHATQRELVDAFATWNLSALPIVDGERRPIGMVSYVDLLRALSG